MRTVAERSVPSVAAAPGTTQPPGEVQKYLERVSKYVPAEVIAVYLAANGFAALSASRGVLFVVIFAACLICTPIYIARFTTTTKEAWTNGTMAVVAFLVWAYATGGGLAQHLGWYDAPTGSVLLTLFTLLSGAVEPKKWE